MDYESLACALTLLLCAALVLVNKHGGNQLKNSGRLPPGPRPWPVIGNIFQLGWAPHRSFSDLAHKHGPIMTLWLGSMSSVVISSNEAAREMFKNHDMVLAGRKIYDAMRGDSNNEGSLITAQYGPYWRTLRRLCTTEFFVASRINAMQGVRRKCIDQMVQFIEEAAGASGSNAIDVGRFFSLMSFNLIGNVMFSRDLLDPKSKRGAKFFHHAEKIMELAGKPNIADYWPILRYFDPQGIRRKSHFHITQAFEIAGEFLKERMEILEKKASDEKKKDYLDVLLEYENTSSEGPSKFSITTINAILLEMFIAGTDTTTSTLEWAMAELLHNPDVLQKVKSELRNTVKPGEKLEEEDLESFPYLNAVIKETLRLHPPLPFLVPHMATDNCNMIGYHIPKDTQILVNVWAIGRDPKTWKNPFDFKPERFLEQNMPDYKGHHFEFLPFGSGRRMCPAVPLASRMLPLTIGSVLHSFDWVLADGLKPEDMDMKEKIGITLRKAAPLKAIPKPYRVENC